MSDNTNARTFKVLSIDGGGIRGLYSAVLLSALAKRYKTKIVEHFDLICGTSTGGLIALGLAMGYSAEEIADFYKAHGSKIFPRQNRAIAFFKQMVGTGKYSNAALRAVLEDLFGSKRIGDAKSLLCIPSYSITAARPFIFRFDHKEGNLGRDNGLLCVDVALATSAAPTYLPIIEVPGIPGQQLVDGGVCANNPASVGLAEAYRYFVGEDKSYSRVDILLIETLSGAVGKRIQKRLAKGALHWRADLVDCFTEGQARMTDHMLERLSETPFNPFSYVRLKSPSISSDKARLLSLDNASTEALKELEAIGFDAATTFGVKPEVASFFESPKTYHLN